MAKRRRSQATTKKEQQCHLDDHFKEAEKNFVDADVKFLGQPLLFDKLIVNLGGLDPQYDGNWYVKRSRHLINPSVGYTTDCKILRNSAGGTPSATNLKQGAGDFNDAPFNGGFGANGSSRGLQKAFNPLQIIGL